MYRPLYGYNQESNRLKACVNTLTTVKGMEKVTWDIGIPQT
ncbi:hypothetical protein CLOSBL3_20378 [Clostridiaceae bacterium BL-3]|nr:hypothetical protein CLOSBL3_20378 [Clostridiaceae bacterium BL-3]